MKCCDLCKNICFKTEFGSAVIINELNLRLCMICYDNFNAYRKIKYKKKILNYLQSRSLGF